MTEGTKVIGVMNYKLYADDNGKDSDDCHLPAVRGHLGDRVATIVVAVAPIEYLIDPIYVYVDFMYMFRYI